MVESYPHVAIEVDARHLLSYVFPFGEEFPALVPYLVDELRAILHLPPEALTCTPASVITLQRALQEFGDGHDALQEIFPHLVACIGEVVRGRHHGRWFMLWRPEYELWEPYIVTEKGEFIDAFTALYFELFEHQQSFLLSRAVALMNP